MANGQLTGVVRRLRRAAFLQPGAAWTDSQLLRDFLLRRDEAAFEALVRRHGPMVLGVCYRVLRSRHDAEDAFQATFLVLVRKAASIKQPELLGNWLYGVAYRTALEARTMVSRRHRREMQIERAPELAAPPDGDADNLRPLIDQELSRLPDRYRQVIVLCDLGGKTRRDAARKLGVAVGTLSGRLTTARRMLAKRLARRGVTLSVAALATALCDGASAAVPPTLVSATVNAAAGNAIIGGGVAALAEGVLKKMVLSKIKLALAFVGAFVVTLSLAALNASSPTNSPERRPAPTFQLAHKPAWQEVLTMRHDHPVTIVACNPEWIAVGDEAGNLFLWDAKTGKNRTLKIKGGKTDGLNASVDRFQFSPDGKHLFTVLHDRKSLFRLDLQSDKPSGGVMGQDPTYLGISPDGDTQLMTYGRILDVRPNILSKGNIVNYEIVRYEAEVIHAVLSADNKTLAAVTADGQLHIHEREALRKLHTLPLGQQTITGLACSADGSRIAVVGNDAFAKVYEAATGKEIAILKGHREGGILFTVAFSPDGKRMATGGDDNSARLWDAATGKQLAVLEGHTDSVRSVAFDPSGETLFTGSADKTVKSWKASR